LNRFETTQNADLNEIRLQMFKPIVTLWFCVGCF